MVEYDKLTAEQLLRRKLDILLRTGKILVESLANTNRVMRNMKRTAAFLGLPHENLHIHIDYDMLMVNISDEEHSFSKFQRCDRHHPNFTAISAVSKLTYRAVRNDYSIETFEAEIERIATQPRIYNKYQVALGAAIACGGYCTLFGGDWGAFVLTMIATLSAFFVRDYSGQIGVNPYMSTALAAFTGTLTAWLTTYLDGITDTPLHPMMSCTLFLVPGAPIINSLDDMIDNYTRVGMIRLGVAAMNVISMAFGIASALVFCEIVFDYRPDIMGISMIPHHAYWRYAVAAASAGVGLSMIFNSPRRLMWVTALAAIVAVVTKNFVALTPDANCMLSLGHGAIIGSLAGAAIVACIAVKAVHWFHTPNHVLTIPAVIPMVPGILMYRSLYALIQIPQDKDQLMRTMLEAAVNGINASLILFSLSLGVAIPTIVARRWINKSKRTAFSQAIEARREQGDFIDLENF